MTPIEPDARVRSLPSDPVTDLANDEAIVALISSHQNALLAYAIALLPNRSDAEDVLQRTNIVLWRKRNGFELGTNFRAWASGIMRLEAKKFFSARKDKEWLLYDEQVASIIGKELSERPFVETSTRMESLRICLNKLSVAHRQLILDRYQLGLSVAECARKSDRTEGGLRVTIHRLRATLRACIEKLNGGEARI